MLDESQSQPERPASGGWSLIVPVKRADKAKSRLSAGPELSRAIALDTVVAAASSALVSVILVVSDEPDATELADGLAFALAADPTAKAPVLTVQQGDAQGLSAAVETGIHTLDAAHAGRPYRHAVLLGDLPALRTADLDEALERASEVPLGVVGDADGTGSTLLTSTGEALRHRFGPGSLTLHRNAGHAELDVPVESSLRRDVDTSEALDAATALGLGPHSLAALTVKD